MKTQIVVLPCQACSKVMPVWLLQPTPVLINYVHVLHYLLTFRYYQHFFTILSRFLYKVYWIQYDVYWLQYEVYWLQ